MKYKFQFETGCIYDGSTEVPVRDFIAEFKGEMKPSLALTIKAHGGQLVPKSTSPKTKKRKVKPVKWSTDEAAAGEVTDLLEKIKRKNEAGE